KTTWTRDHSIAINTHHVAFDITVTHASRRISPGDAHLTGERTAVIRIQCKTGVFGFFNVSVNLSKRLHTVWTGIEIINGLPSVTIIILKTVFAKIIGVSVVSKCLPAIVMGKTHTTVKAILLAIEVVSNQFHRIR